MKEIFILGFLTSLLKLADKLKEGMVPYFKNAPV
jgi:hypothetical protein